MNKFCKYLVDLESAVIVKAYISTSYSHQVTKQRCMLFYEKHDIIVGFDRRYKPVLFGEDHNFEK
ncbi:hypothetical protein V1478_015247 [Vespula squamosa]|uniref:Uncharacterized protein n=1 Tax=Vespula squamosa TaxID=30214 RepID=A0ABD2A4K5_VESSQ